MNSTAPFKKVNRTNRNGNHYVVLIGDAGTGKSTVFNKLVHADGNQFPTTTTESGPILVPESNLFICDTPSCNSIHRKLRSNYEVANALNYRKVSKLIVVVKAEQRMDNVVGPVSRYCESLLRLEFGVLGVMITHMDEVTWHSNELREQLADEIGIDDTVFVSMNTPREVILSNILGICDKKYDIRVDSQNFRNIFKIPQNHVKILLTTNQELKILNTLQIDFSHQRKEFSDHHQPELVSQFIAWVESEVIPQSSCSIERANRFDYQEPNRLYHMGQMHNINIQFLAVFQNIKDEASHYIRHQNQSWRNDIKFVFALSANGLLSITDKTRPKGNPNAASEASSSLDLVPLLKDMEQFDISSPPPRKSKSSSQLGKTSRPSPPSTEPSAQRNGSHGETRWQSSRSFNSEIGTRNLQPRTATATAPPTTPSIPSNATKMTTAFAAEQNMRNTQYDSSTITSIHIQQQHSKQREASAALAIHQNGDGQIGNGSSASSKSSSSPCEQQAPPVSTRPTELTKSNSLLNGVGTSGQEVARNRNIGANVHCSQFQHGPVGKFKRAMSRTSNQIAAQDMCNNERNGRKKRRTRSRCSKANEDRDHVQTRKLKND